eukprot:m.55385 g.55385  ORF g.55385 m.55385 type:complete len:66 (+) comp34469_c0_seq2:64-261(+)
MMLKVQLLFYVCLSSTFKFDIDCIMLMSPSSHRKVFVHLQNIQKYKKPLKMTDFSVCRQSILKQI